MRSIDLTTKPVPPQGVEILSFTPATDFFVHKFIVSQDIGDDFLIQSIRVGESSELSTEDPIPASMFQLDQGLQGDVRFETVKPDKPLTVEVKNISDFEKVFTLQLIGDQI